MALTEQGKIMENDNKNLTDTERIEQFKRRLAAALKRILTETNDTQEEVERDQSNHISQKRG